MAAALREALLPESSEFLAQKREPRPPRFSGRFVALLLLGIRVLGLRVPP